MKYLTETEKGIEITSIPGYLESDYGFTSAVARTLNKQGEKGKHKWILKLPPKTDEVYPGSDINVNEYKIVGAFVWIAREYNRWLYRNRKKSKDWLNYEFDPACVSTLDFMDVRRWERVDENTIAIDLSCSNENLESWSYDYPEYDYRNYNSSTPSIHLQAQLMRAFCGNFITPAIASFLSERFGPDEYPECVLEKTEKELVDEYEDVKCYVLLDYPQKK